MLPCDSGERNWIAYENDVVNRVSAIPSLLLHHCSFSVSLPFRASSERNRLVYPSMSSDFDPIAASISRKLCILVTYFLTLKDHLKIIIIPDRYWFRLFLPTSAPATLLTVNTNACTRFCQETIYPQVNIKLWKPRETTGNYGIDDLRKPSPSKKIERRR